MTFKSRLRKLTAKLKPADDVHYFGWADCTWSEFEGLIRQEGESCDDFCRRVYSITKKQFIWLE